MRKAFLVVLFFLISAALAESDFEKELHRTAGGPNIAVIRFTTTVINPAIEPSLFAIQP
jgi:hypothetical protein